MGNLQQKVEKTHIQALVPYIFLKLMSWRMESFEKANQIYIKFTKKYHLKFHTFNMIKKNELQTWPISLPVMYISSYAVLKA